ncbi:MAG: ribonuclease H-like domain-containing protein [Nitrososphaerota archaeon]
MSLILRPVVYALDIETTSLTADTGQVICIGLAEYFKGKEKIIFVKTPEEEESSLREFIKIFQEVNIYFTWGGLGFDIPFLISRCVRLRIDPTPILEARHIDLMEVSKNHMRLSSNSLQSVSRYLGINLPEEYIGIDVPRLYSEYLAGKKGRRTLIINHCRKDLKRVLSIAKLLRPLIQSIYRDLPNLS